MKSWTLLRWARKANIKHYTGYLDKNFIVDCKMRGDSFIRLDAFKSEIVTEIYGNK